MMADSFKCKKRWAQKDGRASSDTQNMASYGRNRWPVMAGMGGQLRPEWPASYGRILQLTLMEVSSTYMTLLLRRASFA